MKTYDQTKATIRLENALVSGRGVPDEKCMAAIIAAEIELEAANFAADFLKLRTA